MVKVLPRFHVKKHFRYHFESAILKKTSLTNTFDTCQICHASAPRSAQIFFVVDARAPYVIVLIVGWLLLGRKMVPKAKHNGVLFLLKSPDGDLRRKRTKIC